MSNFNDSVNNYLKETKSERKISENDGICYLNQLNGEKLYDAFMIRDRLGVTKSFLTKEMNKHGFTDNDYIIQKNQFLYKEDSLVKFIENLLLRRDLINKRKLTEGNLSQIRDSIKDLLHNKGLGEIIN